jgi:putative flippase GtrA
MTASPVADLSFTREKLMMLVRYGIAGGLTSLVYILVYTNAVHVGLVRFVAAALGYGCALLFQYFAHGLFTFGHRKIAKGRLWRYLFAVGCGFVLAALISQANTKLYTLPDLWVSIIVMGVVATTNFFFFTFWVFAQSPHQSSDDLGKPFD